MVAKILINPPVSLYFHPTADIHNKASAHRWGPRSLLRIHLLLPTKIKRVNREVNICDKVDKWLGIVSRVFSPLLIFDRFHLLLGQTVHLGAQHRHLASLEVCSQQPQTTISFGIILKRARTDSLPIAASSLLKRPLGEPHAGSRGFHFIRRRTGDSASADG